jgi:phosphate transport system substrate-binding protein
MRPIPSRASAVALVVAAALLGGGCGDSSGGGTTSNSETTLTGAGSSLVFPLVSKWADDYKPAKLVYNPIGSGGGIQAITHRQVDFGASDAPLTHDQAQASRGVLMIPWALAGTLFSYHLKGAPNKLKLSGPVIADMYLGKIKKWNDPAIAHLNPGVQLPATEITPVFRIDASGDTYAVTDYLSKVSPQWKSKIGSSTLVTFPTGTGGRGNEGVAASLTRLDGTIGYLAVSYVFQQHLDYALVQNAAGKFPQPGIDSFSAAAKTVKSLPPSNAVSITNPPASAPDAYPVSTFTYALVPGKTSKADPLKKFLTYAIGPGQKFGPALQFAPLPPVVLQADRQAIARLTQGS